MTPPRVMLAALGLHVATGGTIPALKVQGSVMIMIAAGLIWREQVMGHVIAFPLLGCIVGLFPWIIVATIFQVRAGIDFTTAEIIGPIAGFASLGPGAAWFLHDAWRSAAFSRPGHGLPEIERR